MIVYSMSQNNYNCGVGRIQVAFPPYQQKSVSVKGKSKADQRQEFTNRVSTDKQTKKIHCGKDNKTVLVSAVYKVKKMLQKLRHFYTGWVTKAGWLDISVYFLHSLHILSRFSSKNTMRRLFVPTSFPGSMQALNRDAFKVF